MPQALNVIEIGANTYLLSKIIRKSTEKYLEVCRVARLGQTTFCGCVNKTNRSLGSGLKNQGNEPGISTYLGAERSFISRNSLKFSSSDGEVESCSRTGTTSFETR
jgi:hypothetical protein